MGKPYECFPDFYVCIARCEESKLKKMMVLTITILLLLLLLFFKANLFTLVLMS